MRIYKDFTFESAHFLPSAVPGSANARVHGHSFRARVTLDGEPDPKTGLLFHFDELSSAIAGARDDLDHRMLNDVPGLETPTLERIAMWLWNRLDNRLPGLTEIAIMRESCGEGCIYSGPVPRHRMAAE